MPRRALLLGLALLAGCRSAVPTTTGDASRSAVRSTVAGVRYGAYEWNVDDAIRRWQRGQLWRLLRAKGVNQLLLGFDDAQIAAYARPRGTQRMNAFIAAAAAHGVGCGLLLGDPGWIEPAGVPRLIAILKRMRRLHFAVLNLDLEPNEVRGIPIAKALADLIAAMRAYGAASPWPVALDLNDAYAAHAGQRCFVCRLAAVGVRRVVLMTYIADPATVARIDRPILAATPTVAFAIAQDVEPPAVVGSPNDTYWRAGLRRFRAAMTQLDARMRAAPNYTGIVVQSMQYLEAMRPTARSSRLGSRSSSP